MEHRGREDWDMETEEQVTAERAAIQMAELVEWT